MRQAAKLPTQNTQKININKLYEYRKQKARRSPEAGELPEAHEMFPHHVQ